MYFGSVRFFKHVILSVVSVLFLAAVTAAVVFGVKYARLAKNAAEYEAVLSSGPQEDLKNTEGSPDSSESFSVPKGLSSQQIYDAITAGGYAADEILSVYAAEEPDQMLKQCYPALTLKPEVPEYAQLYPDLYVNAPDSYFMAENTVYLTFDDGPSENTLAILSILEKYNIKATFFMSGGHSEKDTEIIKKVFEAGHSIGIHSYSHEYRTIYGSVEGFMDDFHEAADIIFQATGTKPDIIRFAGGSINSYNQLIYKELIAETARRGYVYFDWNVSAEDASDSVTQTMVYNNVINGMSGRSRGIVLMHDSTGRQSTVNALDDIIRTLLDQGYSFDKLTNETKPVVFHYILD